MQTAEDWLKHCALAMSHAELCFGHGTDNAHDEAAWLLLHVLRAPLDGRFTAWDSVLSKPQERELRRLLERRITERCPLAYLTGEARFCGLDFVVTRDVLVPRSPLAELIPERFSPWVQLGRSAKVMDMCTGGGCIAIAMAVHLPGTAVDAVDSSAAALRVAAINIERHAVSGQVHLINSDLFEQVKSGPYDLIVSNPPYVAADVFAQLPAEYRAEPSDGLVSGVDGLDIVLKIIAVASVYLQPQGVLVVEVGQSAATLAKLLPCMPFLWLDFRHGGDGVFLLEYDQLTACQSAVQAVMEQRKNV